MSYTIKSVTLALVLYLATAMILQPTACITAVQGALHLCLDVVIPSLFPFFICSHLFISLGGAQILSRCLSGLMRPLFGVPGCGALAVVLGTVSGYPVGASCIAELYKTGSCTKTEAERLLTFCNNSGPLFVIGAVGVGMLQSQSLGVLLYGSHALAALLTGLFFRRYGKDTASIQALPPAYHEEPPLFAIGAAVSHGLESMLKVCGFILLFAAFTAPLPNHGITPFVYSLLEITGGLSQLSHTTFLGEFRLPVLSFFLALSGLSVLLQTAGIVLPAGLSFKPYLLGKCLQGMLSFGLTYLGLHLFSGAVPTASATISTTFFVPTPNIIIASVLLGLLTLGAVMLAGIVGKYQRNKYDSL